MPGAVPAERGAALPAVRRRAPAAAGVAVVGRGSFDAQARPSTRAVTTRLTRLGHGVPFVQVRAASATGVQSTVVGCGRLPRHAPDRDTGGAGADCGTVLGRGRAWTGTTRSPGQWPAGCGSPCSPCSLWLAAAARPRRAPVAPLGRGRRLAGRARALGRRCSARRAGRSGSSACVRNPDGPGRAFDRARTPGPGRRSLRGTARDCCRAALPGARVAPVQGGP